MQKRLCRKRKLDRDGSWQIGPKASHVRSIGSTLQENSKIAMNW